MNDPADNNWEPSAIELDLLDQRDELKQRVAELERSRDAWEKYYNDMANTKDADIQRLEIQREQIEKRELALRTQLVALYCLRQPDPGISEWYTIRITKDHAERIMEALAK